MEEFYLSPKKPTYLKRELTQYLIHKQLLFKVGVHLDTYAMRDSAIDYGRHVNELVARKLADKIMDEKKMEIKVLDHPLYPDKTVEATALIISPDELMKLLYDFGVQFVKEKDGKL